MDTTDQNTNSANRSQRFEQMFSEAEDKLRSGLDSLSQWGDQARDVFQNRPGVVLSAIAIAGFMTGMITRRGSFAAKGEIKRANFSADPMIVFLTGALAGFALGPKVIEEANSSGDYGSRVTPMSSTDRLSRH